MSKVKARPWETHMSSVMSKDTANVTRQADYLHPGTFSAQEVASRQLDLVLQDRNTVYQWSTQDSRSDPRASLSLFKELKRPAAGR